MQDSGVSLTECDSTAPLQQWEYFSSLGLVVLDSTMAKSDKLCLALDASESDINNSDIIRGKTFKLQKCDVGKKSQRWYYFNHILHLNDNRSFAIDKTSSNDVVLWSKHGETNQRWNVNGMCNSSSL